MKKDSSPRTRAIAMPYWISVVCILAIVLSLFGYFIGVHKYRSLLNGSSSPVGSSMVFSKSRAEMTLSGVYTDNERNVLVARLTPEERSNAILPYKGTDYAVLIQSDSLKGYEKIPILFGKMSTDGDMFLILPKPVKGVVYSIIVVNTKYESSTSLERPTDSLKTENLDLANDQSIARQFSEFTSIDGQAQLNQSDTISLDQNSVPYDIAYLRLALNPKIDSPIYKPVVLPESLVDNQTKEFKFETLFNSVFKNVALKNLKDDYITLDNRERAYNDQLKVLRERLAENPSDQSTIAAVSGVEDNIEEVRKLKESTSEKIVKFESINYEPSLFNNFLNQASVYEID